MNTLEIDLLHLLFGFALILIPLYIFWHYKTKMITTILLSLARMTIQLFCVGFYLNYLFEKDSFLINIAWVVLMILVATQTAIKRTGLSWRVVALPIGIAFASALTLVACYFLGIVIQLDSIFSARYFIPICGILLGNMLSANVIALNHYCENIKREQTYYYYLLGNGATEKEALSPFIRSALIHAFNPIIANVAVMGLVSLPGTLIGQIIGGSSPNTSIRYQIMIILITFTASTLSVVLSIHFSSRKLFDTYGRIQF
ncbi:MAG: ABC transporter permease [Bacteroidaceae bacterium]